ncbi:MAG: hypothetical protein ABI347_08670 [Nitrososphaera sp.]
MLPARLESADCSEPASPPLEFKKLPIPFCIRFCNAKFITVLMIVLATDCWMPLLFESTDARESMFMH